MDDEERTDCLNLLQALKDEGKGYSDIEELLSLLHKYAASHGLDDEAFDLLANVITDIDLGWYHEESLKLKNLKLRNLFEAEIDTLRMYAKDIVGALWYDNPFAERSNAYFLNSIPDEVVKDLADSDLDTLLNINNHYAILPYKWILRKAGLCIDTKEDAMSTALHYYSNVNEFLGIFQT